MIDKICLSEAEWKVISKLWENESMTITQLTATLKEETGWNKSTVITLLKRMEAKNAVAYTQGERAKHYYALLKHENAKLSESFLKRIYNGSIGLMINAMIEQNAISDEELQELQEILNRAEGDKND